MKRLLNILTLCLLIGPFTISCKKEHLTTTSSNPVFYFTGSVGGNAMDLRAGLNNYYMYSSYTQDGNGVYNYTGTLKEYNCSSNCPPSIEFIINDYRSLAVGASENNIGKAFSGGYFNYLVPGGTSTSFSVAFHPSLGYGAQINKYIWNFGDGTDTTIVSGIMDSIRHAYSHTGSYTSFLSVFFTDTTSGSLSNTLQIGNSMSTLNCSITDSMSGYFGSIVSGGTPPYTYSWNFAPGTNDSSIVTYTYPDTLQHTVSLTVTDSSHHTATAKIYAANSNSSAQFHLFSYHTSAPTSSPNAFGLSNITVIYTDASGDQYTSNNPSQPDSSYFHITSVSNYQNNENNQSTKQLHAKFDCILFDNTGKQLIIKNGDAVFAVAYK